MRRRCRLIGATLACGAAVVLLAPFVLIWTSGLCYGMSWFKILELECEGLFVILSVLGPVNASVGVCNGLWSDARRLRPVALVPLLLFLLPTTHYLGNAGRSQDRWLLLIHVCLVAPFVWVAGQVGQEIGVAIRQMLTGAAGQANRPNA